MNFFLIKFTTLHNYIFPMQVHGGTDVSASVMHTTHKFDSALTTRCFTLG
jgi:hypothetical protein